MAVLDNMSRKVDREGLITSTPALNLSGGKISDAALNPTQFGSAAYLMS